MLKLKQPFSRNSGARDKSQYLRIQACTLAPHRPEVALRLLDQYFGLGKDFDAAQAHVDSAVAHLALGNIESAISAYEAALTREAEFPNLRTRAWQDLPFLIARRKLAEHYDRALTLLEMHKDRRSFAIDHFCWHCARALILAERGDRSSARDAAVAALAATTVEHSGLHYHPDLGLVGDIDKELYGRLKSLAGRS